MDVSLDCTPTPTGRCTDCGGTTFCGFAHGGAHDHTQQALNCTAAKLAEAKGGRTATEVVQGLANDLVARWNRLHPSSQLQPEQPLMTVLDSSDEPGAPLLLWIPVENDRVGYHGYLAVDDKGELHLTEQLATL